MSTKLTLCALLLASASTLAAQERDSVPLELEPITVTATRQPQQVSRTASPVIVFDSLKLRRLMPNTAADLFRAQPGLDLTGVGANQTRPSIRGQRGQRILVLSDGLRMNNARRQQDFGELPALVDVTGLERVEVVRGPSSVLYGTDAIGGVMNLIGRPVPPASRPGVHGQFGLLVSESDDQVRPNGILSWRGGRVGVAAGATYRNTQPYLAPAGTFGNVTLDEDTVVEDSGVQDESYQAAVGVDLAPGHDVFGKVELYRARDAGFGRVDNQITGGPFIQILYPDQQVNRFTGGYEGRNLGWGIADRIRVRAHYQENERELQFRLFAAFDPTNPTAGVISETENFTDIQSISSRIEAFKAIGGRHLLTYGIDFFRDKSRGTDVNTTTIIGFGPPTPMVDSTPSAPNATYWSGGFFAQADIQLTSNLKTVLGARYQEVHSNTDPTPNLSTPPAEATNRTVVGAANLLWEFTPGVTLVGAVGRGFRAPNIVELYFEGPTPEGAGFQVRNPDLEPESSINVDVGARVRVGRLSGEVFAFRNEISDGIAIAATGDTVGGFPAFQNVNVDKLRFTGVEIEARYQLPRGFSLGAGYAHLSSKNVLQPQNPVGDSYSNKLSADLDYRHPGGRFWGNYRVRHNGERKESVVGGSPVGDVLPAFTVMDLSAGVRLPDLGPTRNSLSVEVRNLTNQLYAEFPNAGFFRPEPKRNLVVSWRTDF